MSYAVRNDGVAWRAVGGPADCGPDERWQAELPAAPTSRVVSRIVTRRQAMLALLAAGKLDAVEAVISQAPRAVQITWEAAQDFERTNPLIEALAPQLGLAPADIDNLFIEAAKL